MSLIENFPTVVQAVLVVVVFAGMSVTGLYLVRRAVPAQILREDHDVAGFTFGVIGAFYGVVLAFVIVVAWQRFQRAQEKTQTEALALTNMYVLARGFEDPMRRDLIAAVRSYADQVVNGEWTAMAEASYQKSRGGQDRLWKVLLTYEPRNARDQILLDKCLGDLGQLSDARELRYLFYKEDLPAVIWIVIYVGCLITISFSYFFGTRRQRSQAIMCGTFAALIGLTILAISELANPYQGTINVSAEPFKFVISTIDQQGASLPLRPAPHALATSGGRPGTGG
jgi:Protein of unknown function (DUF4239)